jgi:hypothetical protein
MGSQAKLHQENSHSCNTKYNENNIISLNEHLLKLFLPK